MRWLALALTVGAGWAIFAPRERRLIAVSFPVDRDRVPAGWSPLNTGPIRNQVIDQGLNPLFMATAPGTGRDAMVLLIVHYSAANISKIRALWPGALPVVGTREELLLRATGDVPSEIYELIRARI